MTGDSATAVREPRLTTEAEVSRAIQDGMTIAVGGFINAAHPMSLVRRIIADRKKDLTVVGAPNEEVWRKPDCPTRRPGASQCD